jgi:hypothetical protein
MWNAVAGIAHVLCLSTGNVEVDPQQNILLEQDQVKIYKKLLAIVNKHIHNPYT